MIKSYFFIPANHPKIFDKIQTIQADSFIIDLEDAFDSKDELNIYDILKRIPNKQEIWVRPKLIENNKLHGKVLIKLCGIGFANFVLPKIRNVGHLKLIEKCIGENSQVILLVENPECLHNLPQMVEKTKLSIAGIGFGSQDYCLDSGMKHESNLLHYPRFIISNTAKAYGIKCIDIACMEIEKENLFREELAEAFSMGYDGKFIIHPKQLNILKSYPFYSKKEIDEAEKVLSEYERLGKPSVFQHKGKAIEPPHINNFLKIKSWRDKHEKK